MIVAFKPLCGTRLPLRFRPLLPDLFLECDKPYPSFTLAFCVRIGLSARDCARPLSLLSQTLAHVPGCIVRGTRSVEHWLALLRTTCTASSPIIAARFVASAESSFRRTLAWRCIRLLLLCAQCPIYRLSQRHKPLFRQQRRCENKCQFMMTHQMALPCPVTRTC